MPVFVLERVIRCTPQAAFELSLDPGMHVRSMAAHGERMLAGPPGEQFEEGDTVTWQARHFGFRFRLTSVVFDIDPPNRFCDRQIRGPFARFHHEHVFAEHPLGTHMRDTIDFRSPFGPLGALVDRLVMTRHLRRVITERNDALSAELEG